MSALSGRHAVWAVLTRYACSAWRTRRGRSGSVRSGIRRRADYRRHWLKTVLAGQATSRRRTVPSRRGPQMDRLYELFSRLIGHLYAHMVVMSCRPGARIVRLASTSAHEYKANGNQYSLRLPI